MAIKIDWGLKDIRSSIQNNLNNVKSQLSLGVDQKPCLNKFNQYFFQLRRLAAHFSIYYIFIFKQVTLFLIQFNSSSTYEVHIL